MPLSPGQTLNNRYRVVKLLGQGGFGAVYRAWDFNLERPRALKENLGTSPEAQRQFKREAQMLADLSHPSLPRVLDHFIIPGQGQYLVMDFVDGEDLQQLLDRHGGPLPESMVLPWIEQVLDALAYLHSHNPPIIHRDIKPANIKITPEGRAMLVDFGIAKVFDPSTNTTVGARAITPGYSPQEQYGSGSTDARTDMYALGATLYHLLTGEKPPESIQRHLGAQLAPPRALNPAISVTTEASLMQAMQMHPSQRLQSAPAFKAALHGGVPRVPGLPPTEVVSPPAAAALRGATPGTDSWGAAPPATYPAQTAPRRWNCAAVAAVVAALGLGALICLWVGWTVLQNLALVPVVPATKAVLSTPAVEAGGVTPTAEIVRQWASSATASSQYGDPDWGASQATGRPDTPDCGDQSSAWASQTSDGQDWIELSFDQPVTAQEIRIYQSYHPSQIKQVDLLGQEGNETTVYEAQPSQMGQCPYVLSIDVGETSFAATGVRITLDQSVLGLGWNEIDAVELVGAARPWMGVRIGELTSARIQAMGLPEGQTGVYIEEVVPGGPADQAGLRGSTSAVTVDDETVTTGGDIIVAVDGQTVDSTDPLFRIMSAAVPGQRLRVSVLRDGERLDFDLTLQAWPEVMPTAQPTPAP
ncbi:MAG: protein kinase [Chloroflexota bacterium]